MTDLRRYFNLLCSACRRALGANPESVHGLSVANHTVTLRFANTILRQAILPALAHLEHSSLEPMALFEFDLCDSASSGVLPPRPPFAKGDYHRYGHRAVAYHDSVAIMHVPEAGLLFAYDRASHHGIFWCADASALSIYERAAPLQTLFHWALSEYGWQIVHAAGLGTEQGGVLLVGNSGAGKSTTALSCLAQDDIKYLCDDKCLVRLEPEPQAFALYSSGKIKGDMLGRLPHFHPMLAGWDEKSPEGKGLVFLHPTYTYHMVASFPVKALVIPTVAHRAQAMLQPASAGHAFRLVGPSTVIWLPGAEADTYRLTAELVRRLPCHRIDLASEPQTNADAIRDLLHRLLDATVAHDSL